MMTAKEVAEAVITEVAWQSQIEEGVIIIREEELREIIMGVLCPIEGNTA